MSLMLLLGVHTKHALSARERVKKGPRRWVFINDPYPVFVAAPEPTTPAMCAKSKQLTPFRAGLKSECRARTV